MTRKRTWLLVALFAVVTLAVGVSAPAVADDDGNNYVRIATIAPPGASLTSFDISWVDRSGQTYYLADRSNKGIDIVDARTDRFVGRIGGFVGFTGHNETSGPDGVLVIHSAHELWAGDGKSTVQVVDLRTNTIVASIATGTTDFRADELAYDARDRIIVVANDADAPPFVTFIDQRSRAVRGPLPFPDATNGLEQPVWDPRTGLFYMSVPELGGDPAKGEIAVMDPMAGTLVNAFAVSECEPAGLALGPHQHLLVGCSLDAILAGFKPKTLVLDALTGATVATITQVGGSDQVWFNRGDDRYYLAARGMTPPVLGVIDAETN